MLSSWWARQGSNLRPTGYEPAALPLSYGPSRQLYSIVGGEEMPAALTEASDVVLSGPPTVATFLELLAKKLGND